jgi:hypothetical protein
MDAVARAKLAPTGLAEENLLSLLSTLNARVVDGLRLGLSAKAAAMEQQARHRPVALRSAPLRCARMRGRARPPLPGVHAQVCARSKAGASTPRFRAAAAAAPALSSGRVRACAMRAHRDSDRSRTHCASRRAPRRTELLA